MEIYSIARDKDRFGIEFDVSVDAGHPWCLPGVQCDECGNTWGAVGIEYPSVKIPRRLAGRLQGGVASVEEFQELREEVVRDIRTTLPKLSPGAQFGPLIGRVFGTTVSDFCWASPWTVFVTRRCYDMLISHGIVFSGSIPLVLRGAKRLKQDFVELQIEPTLNIEEDSFLKTSEQVCGKCGHSPKKLAEVIVRRHSIPSGCDLFRAAQFPTVLLASERLVRTSMALGLRNVVFKRVKSV